MKFILLAILCCYYGYVQAALQFDEPTFDSAFTDCRKQIPVLTIQDLENFYLMPNLTLSTNENAKCHLKCILEKYGYFKNGKLDADFTIDYLTKLPNFKNQDAAIKKGVNDCKDVKETTDCVTATSIYQCYLDKSNLDFFPA